LLLPHAISPAREDVFKEETIRIISTVLIEKGGLIFMNGAIIISRIYHHG
jgi:hypothetical protein